MERTITQIGVLVHVVDARLVAGRGTAALPIDVAVDAEVDAGTTDGDSFVRVRVNVSVADIDHETPRPPLPELPCSIATHGDVFARSIGCCRGKELT